MTHFFNNKQVLMENVSFQDLTPKVFKNGFVNEGVMREMEYYKVKYQDGIVFGMFRKD